jgi:hypothetical protein
MLLVLNVVNKLFMLNVIMLSVIMSNVIMLGVVAPNNIHGLLEAPQTPLGLTATVSIMTPSVST